MLNDKILVFHIKTDAVIICPHLCEPNFFFFNKGSKGQVMGSWCHRKTSQQASCSHPAFRVLLAALFSIPEFHTFQ